MKLVIFGCGRIANRIALGCKKVEGLDLVGFASKDIAKAKQYSELYECKKYGDYDYFLNSDVDGVYIATYNKAHYDLIKQCLLHHKNVICEKPMLFSIKDNEELFELAKENNVLLMEALKSVFLPINIKIKQMIKNNSLGELKYIYASFMRNGNHDKSHWINDLDCGGALYDLGSYCIGTMNYLMDINPTLISIESDRTDEYADTSAVVNLKYGNVNAKASVSNSKDGDNFLYVEGSNGYIKVENYWKTGTGYYEINNERFELNEECINDFYYELKHFNYLVDHKIIESDVMSKQASENILKITGASYDNTK